MSKNAIRQNHSAVNTINALQTALTMPEVLARLGIQSARSQNGLGFVICPSHNEDTPSCKIYSDHAYCFGCGKHFDVIGMVQQVRGYDFWPALEWIAAEAGMPRPQRSLEVERHYQGIKSVAETYAALWQESLNDPEAALVYLEQRGISREMTEGRAGYLPKKYHPGDVETAQRAGLLSSKGNFLFNGRLIVPIYSRGQLVSLYGRALDPERIPKHVYPATTDPPMPPAIWNLDECRPMKHVYLCESIIDAMTLHSHGFTNTIAVFGTQGLTEARLELLKRIDIEKLTLIFDSDANGSGQAGAMKTGEALFRAGYAAEIVELPLEDGEEKCDPNSYFLKHTAGNFRAIEARDYFDLRLTLISSATPQELYRALKPTLKLVAGLPELIRPPYLKRIRDRFPYLDGHALKKEVGKYDSRQESKAQFRPLTLVDQIRKEAPVICHDGRAYRYHKGAYRLLYVEEVDQTTIRLVGEDTQTSHLEAIRKFLNSVCFVRPEEINPRHMLNLSNGIINLSSGEWSEHSPELKFTVQTDVRFDPTAECPLWLQTVAEILPDPDSRGLLAQIFGYSLVADNSYQKGFIFFGDGANGKSLITDVLYALLGRENCSTLTLGDLGDKFRLAELQNKLVNFSPEVDESGLVSDGRIKAIIGGDPLTAERKNKDPFSFRPFCRLIVSCNHLPETNDRSYGYFRRWIVLPFPQTFLPETADLTRGARIISTELSGVLNWAIGGYKALQDQGKFNQPTATLQALDSYRRQIDPTLDFVDECLSVFQSDGGSPLSEIYDAYRKWIKEVGREAVGRNKFRAALERVVGRMRIKDHDTGVRFIPGVWLR